MLGVIALLIVATLSVVITKVGAVALESTGMSHDLALFQSRSAFTGVGFTTREAESVVSNPARRRIITFLMLTGNVGTVTVIASLVLGFSSSGAGAVLQRFGVLLVGLIGVWAFTRTDRFDHWVKAGFRWLVDRLASTTIRDYEALLNVHGDYGVRELEVEQDGWLARQTLRELDLLHEGVLVLAVWRADGGFVGAPVSDTELHPGDRVVAYGRADGLEQVQKRRRGSGQRQHHDAVRDQQAREGDERARADGRSDAA